MIYVGLGFRRFRGVHWAWNGFLKLKASEVYDVFLWQKATSDPNEEAQIITHIIR